MSFRKARTRTLIQLGGLVEKSGLLEELGLKAGDDLQRNIECMEGAAILMGGLSELRRNLDGEATTGQKLLWAETGKKILGE
ncbi:MAG: conjugal transfer protein TraD [Alphaproteobacteria bacterium]|nr:conjugal transfer protein TraD [Alphaproteobacteria bacterium]